MRFVSALVCAALLASGLTSALAVGRGRVLMATAVLGVTPLALSLAGSINPNGVEIAAAFCVWLSLLALGTGSAPIAPRLIVRAAVASVVLAMARPLSPLILVGIVATVALATWDRQTPLRLWAVPSVRPAAVTVTIVALATGAYTLVFRSASTLIELPLPGSPSRGDIARTSLGHTGMHLQSMVTVPRVIQFRQLAFPPLLVPGWTVVVACVVAVALVVGSWRQRLVLAALVLGVVALPVVADTASAARYGYAWQGRYAVPVAMGITILSGWIIDRSAALGPRLERAMAVAVAGYVAVGYVVAELSLMAFNLSGPLSDWIDGAGHGPWTGPLTPSWLASWAIVTSVALAGWLVALSWRPTDC